MIFQLINFNEKEKWKNLIGKEDEVYYLWEYVSALKKNGDGEPILIYGDGQKGQIYTVCLKRDISKNINLKNKIQEGKLFDLITPYGYGGLEIRGEISSNEKEEFFDKISDFCQKNNIISEFIRLNPLSDNFKNYEKDYITRQSSTVFIKLENEEQIWGDMKPTCRNRIRKAIKEGLIVKSGFGKVEFTEFIQIYKETMKRSNADEYYFFSEEFFEDIESKMKNNAMIYTVYLNNKPIDSVLAIYSGENAHYHLGGTLSDYMNLGAHNLCVYEAAKDCMKKGYKKFHLGGGYGGDESPLLRFKKTFSKQGGLDFYIGKKIWNKDIYTKLVNIRKKEANFDETSSFFPLYRK